MGGLLAPQHLLLLAVIALLLFGGRGKISSIMGDFAQGIKAFKKGLADDNTADSAKSDAATKSIDHQAAGEAARRAEADSKVERSLS